MKDRLLEHKNVIISLVLVVAGVFFYYFDTPAPSVAPNSDLTQTDTPVAAPKTQDNQAKVETAPKTVLVDVKGEVKNPGVYQAGPDERVIDAINKAGGLTGKADKNQVNLAQRITDEMVITVPAIGSAPEQSPLVQGNAPPSVSEGKKSNNGVVNLNNADATQLETLPGVGPSRAAAIIDYRTKNGPFKNAEDLKQISGIGDKTFEKLKSRITVN